MEDRRGRSIFHCAQQWQLQKQPPGRTSAQSTGWRGPGSGRRPRPPLSQIPGPAEKEAAGDTPLPVTSTAGEARVLQQRACASICEHGPGQGHGSPLGHTWQDSMRPGADQGLSEHGRPKAASLNTSKCPPTSPYPSPLFWPLGSFQHQWSPSSWKSPLSLSAWFCANSSGPSLSYGSSPTCFLKDFSCSPFSALRAIPVTPRSSFIQSTNTWAPSVCQADRGDQTPAWHFHGGGRG